MKDTHTKKKSFDASRPFGKRKGTSSHTRTTLTSSLVVKRTFSLFVSFFLSFFLSFEQEEVEEEEEVEERKMASAATTTTTTTTKAHQSSSMSLSRITQNVGSSVSKSSSSSSPKNDVDENEEKRTPRREQNRQHPLSDLQKLRLSSIEKLNELVLNGGGGGGGGEKSNLSTTERNTNDDDDDDDDKNTNNVRDDAYDAHNGSYDSSPGSDEYDEANAERKLRQKLRLEAANNQSKKDQLTEKLEKLLSLDQDKDAKNGESSDVLSSEDTWSSNESTSGLNNGGDVSGNAEENTNNHQGTPNTPTTTVEDATLSEIPTQMPKFMIWLPTVPSKEGTLEKYTEVRGNWFTNLMRGFGGRNDSSWKLRHFVLYDNHLFWGKGFSRMYGYGSVLAARNAFEYGETAISIDLLLYPKKSSRHGSSSTSTPQNIVEALTGACCQPAGYSHKIVRCETLSDKDSWLEVLNRTASMQREREEKEQRSREQREREQRQQIGTSSSANQRNATTSESSEETAGYTIQPPSPRISEDGHAYGSEESKRLARNRRESRDYFARTDGERHQRHQLSPTIGSPLITTDEESEESMSESDDYDNNSDYDDDDDYTEDDGYRMNSGADSSTNSSGLKTHASMLKHNDSEDSLSLSLDAQNGIPPSSDDSNRHRPKNMDQSSSRGLVRTGSGSVKFRNRSLSPAPNQRSPGSTPRSARAANKHKNGVFTSSPRNELTRTSNNSKKPPPASSPSGASKYSASKPPFDPNARPKQSSMKRSAIYSAFSAAQQQLLDDTNKIAAQQQQEEEGGGNGVSTPPPHMQNLNSPRTTGGSKKSVTFRNDASLEEVKKYEATPTNGKKKKKSHMFQNNISASAWAEQLERRSSRALIRAAGSWSISINDLIFGKKIGTGSFGKVYKAKWHGTNVAVKKTLGVSTHATVKEFAAEIRLMRDLRHPNIVLFLGAVVDAPSMCIVTELMKRGNLHSILHDHDNIVRETVADNGRLRLQMATDCARGMSYLHSRSPPIVHHDLKPANLLVDSKWNLKISDFGMSRIKYRAYLQKSNPELETAGGTPEWMSPEALRNDNVDELSDVYSFGIILWELITLNYPWHELNDPVQIVGKVAFLHHRPKIPSWVETEMEELLSDCWSRESCDRPEFTHILELLRTISTPGAWSLGKGDNALEVKRSKFSQYLQDEHLEAAVNTQDTPEVHSFFGFGGIPSRQKESGSITSISSSQYNEAEDPYIPQKNDSLDGDNDSDQSKEDKRGHQRRQSHENILAFRPNSLTGLTIKTPAPVPDGREHDRPDDKRKGLGGLKIKTGNKKTTSATPKAASVASPVAEGNKLNTLEQLDTLDDDELDDDELDDGETDDDEDLESEVSGFSQLSEAQQQKMNKFKEQQMKAKSKRKNNRGSSTSSGTTERSADEKHNEGEEEPKTPRNAKGAVGRDVKEKEEKEEEERDEEEEGDEEERGGKKGARKQNDAFPSRAPAAAAAGRGGGKKKKTSVKGDAPSKPFANQL